MSEKRSDPRDLRQEFRSLWHTTLKQLDGWSDVLVESSAAGKAKLDATLLRRERDLAIARFGAQVLALADAGDVVLPPALAEHRAEIHALERAIEEQDETFRRRFSKG